MKKLILLLLFVGFSVMGTTFTEFYVDPAGGNTNSGQAIITGGSYNAANVFHAIGFWTNTGAIFANASLNPSGFSVGDWAAVYTNTATVAAYVSKISATNATTITLTTANAAGTDPVNDTAGFTWIVVGGAWAGPNTNQNPSVTFPLGFMANTATNAYGAEPRVNFKVGTYSFTNAVTLANNGPVRYQGFTTTAGDGGKATFTGTGYTASYSFTLITVTGNDNDFEDLIFDGNGNTGSPSLFSISSATRTHLRGCVFRNSRNRGLDVQGTYTDVVECIATSNNVGNATSSGMGNTATGTTFKRCISRGNLNASGAGFRTSEVTTLIDCIADFNAAEGFIMTLAGGGNKFQGCNAYKNAGAGLSLNGTGVALLSVENCNFVQNGGAGITNGSALRHGIVANCGFGSGTATNAAGNILNLGGAVETGTIVYAANATPWTSPDSGNYIPTTAAKAMGRGYFTQTEYSPNTTISYPDIGAVQAASTNASASSGGSYTFAQ